MKMAIFAIILGLTGQQLLNYGVAATDPARVASSVRVTNTNNFAISPLATAGVDPIWNKPLPLLAMFAGSFMLIGSFILTAWLIIALRHRKLAPATGVFYDSHFYNGPVPTDNFEQRIQIQMSQHRRTATDEVLSSIANPRLPEPGTSINPHDTADYAHPEK